MLLCPFQRKVVVQHLIQSYQRLSGTAMVRGFHVNYKRHTLTMDDLSTLYGQNWLNDQVLLLFNILKRTLYSLSHDSTSQLVCLGQAKSTHFFYIL